MRIKTAIALAVPILMLGTIALADSVDPGFILDNEGWVGNSWTTGWKVVGLFGLPAGIDGIQMRVRGSDPLNPLTFENAGISSFRWETGASAAGWSPSAHGVLDGFDQLAASGEAAPLRANHVLFFDLTLNTVSPNTPPPSSSLPLYFDMQAYSQGVRKINQTFRYTEAGGKKWWSLQADGSWRQIWALSPQGGGVGAWDQATMIPEPLTLAGLGIGLVGVVGYIRKRRAA